MTEYIKEDLISILSNYDFSHVDLAEIPGKQYQPAGRKVNIEEYKKFIASYPDIFKDKKDFIRFLLDLREHTLEEIVDNAMCPICGKFVHVMEMHSGKRHTCKEHWGQYMKILYEKKTGYKDPYSNPDVIKKRKENFIEKYGVEHPMQLKEIQEKRIQTDLQNHNGKLYCQTKEGKQQIMQTNLDHHGGVFNLNTEYAKNRLKEVCQEKFGTDNPLQCKEVREKQIEMYGGMGFANKENYDKATKTHGGIFPGGDPEVLKKTEQTIIERYGSKSNLMKLDSVQNKVKATMMKRYGVEYYTLSEECNAQNVKKVSKTNLRFAQKLESIGLKVEFEKVIGNRSFDIEIVGKNIVIEINPTYTHNSSKESVFGKMVDKNYHKNKMELANKHEYQCITIWDWDDTDKVVNILKQKAVIYARNCELRVVDQKEANDFLEKYHLQGKLRGKSANFGLYFNNELVEIMTFGQPRYNTHYEYELLRLCTNTNYTIVGGASKLFSFFLEKVNPNSIISYCDSSKFSGKVYLELGFEQKDNSRPSAHWSKGNKQITDNQLRKYGPDKLIGTNYGLGTNNEEIMISEGWRKVYDCGQKVFVWKSKT